MNRKIIVGIVLLVIVVLLIVSTIICLNTKIEDNFDYSSTSVVYENENYVSYVDESNIMRDKSNMKGMFKLYYDKYIAYTAPNKKNIFIVATKSITDAQLLYAYSVLENYLISDNGYDMDLLANTIANSNSYIVIAEGSDGESKTPMFAILGQPLYYNEVAAPGTVWFMENNYDHRDATFEEILHFTHDNGIGTTQNPGVFPEFARDINQATFNALPVTKDKWGIEGLWGSQVNGQNNTDWLFELEKEGSLEQEYLASVIDSYYGLWGPYNETTGGMWGMYIAKTREEIYTLDPIGSELLDYFNGYLSSMITIDSSLSGVFSLSFDEDLPYTYKTQYYQYIRLTGNNDISVIGNGRDNIFIGNNGNNTFDGVLGTNVVQYNGILTDFTISVDGNKTYVLNNVTNVVGELINISIIRFQDIDILSSSSQSSIH